MPGDALYSTLVVAVFIAAAVTVLVLMVITAPYGRHSRGGWGPQVPARVGWVIMEAPTVLVFAAVYVQGGERADVVPALLLGLWMLHYVPRTFVFPFRMRGPGRPMPLVVAGIGLMFQTVNSYVNARWISELGGYAAAWLWDPRFVAGAALFVAGWWINQHADATLRRLRAPGEHGYRIPRGGLYEWVCCPNYLGEMLEWTGWAIATWSLAGASFAVYTAANLVPRAIAHHRWYRETFPDYPSGRRAVVPFVL